MLTTKAVRAKPQEAIREVICANGSIVLAAAVFRSARFADTHYSTVVLHLSDNCYQFTDPGGMNSLVDRAAQGVEPGTARLVVQEVKQRATVSTRPCRQTNTKTADNLVERRPSMGRRASV